MCEDNNMKKSVWWKDNEAKSIKTRIWGQVCDDKSMKKVCEDKNKKTNIWKQEYENMHVKTRVRRQRVWRQVHENKGDNKCMHKDKQVIVETKNTFKHTNNQIFVMQWIRQQTPPQALYITTEQHHKHIT